MINVGGYMPFTKPHPFHYKYQEYLYRENYFMKDNLFAPFTTRAILCIKERRHFTGEFFYICTTFNYCPMRCFDIIPFSSEYNKEIVSLFLGEEI